jgi:hypothetical protein
MQTRAPWLLLLVAALASAVVELQWRHALSWDEVEFFRASRWIAEGKVPYRDFWEHHVPLQWFLFAPVAALFGGGTGVAAVLAMRWAQVPLWIAFFAIFFVVARQCGLSLAQRWIAVLLLLASSTFAVAALEFRVDLVGHLGYFASLAIVCARPRSPRAWLAFGALMSLGVLANMRMAPLVIVTGALAFVIRLDERRWRFNRAATTMLIGVATVAAAFLAWLFISGAVDGFRDGMNFNIVSDRLLSAETNTLVPTLLLPFTRADVAAIALLLAGVAGAALALRQLREPGPLQLIAMLAIVSVFFFMRLGVHYVYHYGTTLLLLAPLAASLVTRARAQQLAALIIGAALALQLGRLVQPGLGATMRYQDAVMRAVHARTLPHERVFDGVGYAIHRPPAYRYWFLPSGVRMLAQRGAIEPYGLQQMAAAPPAAIVYGYRLAFWFGNDPAAATYAMRHYIPVYRDLWVPGLSARIDPARPRAAWRVPRDGVYRLHASELLAKHPWFRESLANALTIGENAPLYEVPLERLPPADPGGVRVTVDGVPVRPPVVTLKKGQVVRLDASWPVPVGVLFAPADVTELFIAPRERFAM